MGHGNGIFVTQIQIAKGSKIHLEMRKFDFNIKSVTKKVKKCH